MDPARANAYRLLLYHALLDIRGLAWIAWKRSEQWSLLFWLKSLPEIRAKGALADWLHNLAHFAAHDFADFNEEWFWKEYEGMKGRHGKFWYRDYRKSFDEYLAGRMK